MDEIHPLTRQQQIFLQRLFAQHVLTDHQAQSLFQEILTLDETNRNELGRDVKDAFKRINRSLMPAFRLEIKSVSLALPIPSDGNDTSDGIGIEIDGGDDSDDDGGNNYTSSTSRTTSHRKQKRPQQIIYHSIVNCDSDEVAKTTANPTFTKSPHEFAFFRLLLERLIEKDMNQNPNQDSTESSSSSLSSSGKGCNAALSRMEMINSRLDLTGPHEGKLTVGQAENALNLLEVQGWFVPASVPAPSSNGDDTTSMSSPAATRRTGTRGSNSNSSNTIGGEAKYLQIGPRSYLEFPDFLIKAGLDNHKLPQFLVHG